MSSAGWIHLLLLLLLSSLDVFLLSLSGQTDPEKEATLCWPGRRVQDPGGGSAGPADGAQAGGGTRTRVKAAPSSLTSLLSLSCSWSL